MSLARSALALGAVATGAVALAGCGKTVDQKDLQDKIADNVEKRLGARPEVHCPKGEKAEAGTTFTCQALVRDSRATVQVRLTGENRFSFRVFQPAR